MTAATDPAQRGTTMLALPHAPSLTEDQREGGTCPWCGTPLTPATSIDLGVRPGPYGVTIHPRGCRACVNTEARRVYAHHCRVCSRCQMRQYCDTHQVLRRLALETRSPVEPNR